MSKYKITPRDLDQTGNVERLEAMGSSVSGETAATSGMSTLFTNVGTKLGFSGATATTAGLLTVSTITGAGGAALNYAIHRNDGTDGWANIKTGFLGGALLPGSMWLTGAGSSISQKLFYSGLGTVGIANTFSAISNNQFLTPEQNLNAYAIGYGLRLAGSMGNPFGNSTAGRVLTSVIKPLGEGGYFKSWWANSLLSEGVVAGIPSGITLGKGLYDGKGWGIIRPPYSQNIHPLNATVCQHLTSAL